MLRRIARALAVISSGSREEQPGGGAGPTEAPATGAPAERKAPAHPRVRDLMREGSDVVHPDHTLREALGRMQRQRIGFLPVADGAEVVGTLEAEEIERLGADHHDAAVRDHMEDDVAFCYADDAAETALGLMNRMGRKGLCVVDHEHELVGLVEAEAVAARLGPAPAAGSEAAPSEVADERHAESGGRALGDDIGTPPAYSIRPKIKR